MQFGKGCRITWQYSTLYRIYRIYSGKGNVMLWTGGCLCGAVMFRAEGEPMDVASCHCINCRKMSGAAFATFVVFPPDKFEWIQGELGNYAATPDLVRGFCRDCGSPVASWRNSERDKWIIAWAGTLDQADKLKPQHHIFAKDELPWLNLKDGLHRYDLFPDDILQSLGLDSTTRNEQIT
jgi:hypothetical protein